MDEQEAAKAHRDATVTIPKPERRARAAESQVKLLQKLLENCNDRNEKMERLNTRTIWAWRFISLFLFVMYLVSL